jgi:hypothetical protein
MTKRTTLGAQLLNAFEEPGGPNDPARSIWYAIGAGIWGRGASEAEALKNLKAQGTIGDRYLIYRVTPETNFYSDRSFSHPQDDPAPLLVKRVRKVNRRWQEEIVNE